MATKNVTVRVSEERSARAAAYVERRFHMSLNQYLANQVAALAEKLEEEEWASGLDVLAGSAEADTAYAFFAQAEVAGDD